MAENRITLEDTLEALVEGKKYSALREILITMNPADIAALFEDLEQEKLPLLFRLLPKELAAETFVEMEPDAQELLIRGFSDNELKDVIDELYVDDAVDIVEEMPANVVKRILRQADPEMRKMINEILQYPEDSAGSIMTTEYVDLRPQMTAEEAIKRIRRTGVDKETIYTCYVTDSNRKLIGMVSMRTLLLAEEDDVLQDIMETNVISVNTLEDQATVAGCSANILHRPCRGGPGGAPRSIVTVTTPWMFCRRRPPRTSKKWRPSPRWKSHILKPGFLRPGGSASRGC
jgi:magnesium transporter